ncbi:helix-turn-helix transcriptional regulator [Polaribacter sp. R2A056_3_33]|jgi:transcriptional regulator with XRE-family HTH domain|uniref:helix-turn-helix domain-containing protein n=1 Tax=Polaribacter sp. R2A056_3_33 TaxID=2745563 RepID=UPI001C4FC397|nr:helix-turn-helix transcriptional regulator [Polaribacter sp. R2A056_3_33]QXP69199.1 helix-turn-helix transcriptional regulator [Polaribacter sp. R2A056_3_33]
MEFPKENILDTWLEENQNAEIDRFIERNLEITQKVCVILKQRGIKKIEFAKMLNKKPSEITKWLSGLHNLTLKSITKMEVALGVDLMNPERKYVYLGMVAGGSQDLVSAKDDYEQSYYTQEAV